MAELVIAVGGIFLAPVLQVAFDRITSSRKFIEFFKGKKGIEFDEEVLARLDRTLYKIHDVLEDAEVKEGAKGVRTWLGKVRAEVNHADDLLDEFNYECLRLQLLGDEQTEPDLKAHQPDLKARRCCFPFRKPKTNPGNANATHFIEKLMPQLRNVTDKLEGFVKEIKDLGLQKLDSKEKHPYRPPSSSVVNTSQIFGREDEKETIIRRVLSDGGTPDVSVIAITGMGGIGKTTLAQLVYNDDRVKKKFSTRAWACVSEKYDAIKVTKDLLREVSSAVVDKEDSFNGLQEKLIENLKGKCFLIILDDIWNEDYIDWDSLKNPLNHGGRGSKIIVTTRSENIAFMMQNEPPFHHVEPIQEDESWCLFKSHAFDEGDHASLQRFETIGKKIVKKCNGLPLAIKTVAGALRSKRDINGWQKFLSSEDWAVVGDILPALRLSYKHLPSHLKGCFAYCALFPKDDPFNKDDVVLLWMANDLASTLEVGRVYFEELKSRSFFELVDGKLHLMHDLINDLARSIAGNTCIRLEDYQAAGRHQIIQRENELPPEVLHFSYLDNRSEPLRFSGLGQARSLRTFLPIHQSRLHFNLHAFFLSDILPKLECLRALSLSQYKITMVPDSIGGLKHLRLLNLSSTYIKKLPNAICKCLNLQTLILEECGRLVELPQDMSGLINLQHLDVRGVGEPLIKTMSTWLKMFKDIQNISVIVDKIQGNELELLVQLQLCNSLNIIGLGDTNVATIERARSVGLIDKDYIEDLTLEWGDVVESSQEALNKFVKLQPHKNTKRLSVQGYPGSLFPDWLSASNNIKSLTIQNCKKCLSLPPLGQLTALKELRISGMDGISEIGEEFYGDVSTSKPFQTLEELEFSDMAEWAIWNTHSELVFPSLKSLSILNCSNILSFPEGGLAAPNLRRLKVYKCSKMKSLPVRMHTQLPLLSLLDIWDCPEIECFPEGGVPSSLETLHIVNCSKMKSLPVRMHTQLPLLTYLSIRECPEIECFPEGGLPSTLEILDILNCSKMRNCQTNWGLQTLPSLKEVWLSGFEDTLFPEEGLLPTTLQKLIISDFSNLESVNEKGLQHLSSLQSLYIWRCPNLQYLPQQKFSSSLSELSITRCDLLESFPEGLASSLSTLRIISGCPKLAARIEREKGEDWHKVSHIPIIYIDIKRI